MKSAIVLQALLCLCVNVYAQNNATIKPLTIGDTVPDIFFTKIINYPGSSVKLSDLKGKVVILDFWATWCGPCVEGLPKLSAFQAAHREDLTVLPIDVGEEEKAVKLFMAKRKEIQLPSVIGDEAFISHLKTLFPFTGIPHAVIIGRNGRVLAITASADIHESAIRDAIAGRIINLPVKKDNMTFRFGRSILEDNNAQIQDNNILRYFQSVLTREIPGVPTQSSPITNDTSKKGFYMLNHLLGQLYGFAYNRPDIWRYALITEKDSLANDLELFGGRRKSYSYQYMASRNMKDEEIRSRMRDDLDKAFGVKSVMETRSLPCYFIVKKEKIKNLASSRKIHSGESANDSVSYDGFTMDEIALTLSNSLYCPLRNKTDITYPVHIILPVEAMNAFLSPSRKDITLLRKTFQQYGLDLIPGTDDFEALILHTAQY